MSKRQRERVKRIDGQETGINTHSIKENDEKRRVNDTQGKS